MRRCLPLLALLLLAGSVTSCRDTSCRDALQHAEALMETDPHAARAVLDSIDPPPTPPVREGRLSPLRGSGKGVFALYALLRTQADYKCYVRLTSDSLPLIATNYYGTKRKTQHAALAQYYLGCTYSDMSRDLDAIDAFLRATTLFPDTTNKYYAYCQRDYGELLLQHERKVEALQAFRHYRFSDICRTDSVNVGWADWYMGEAYLYMNQAEQAEPYLLRVIANPYLSKKHHANTRFQLAKLYAFLNGDYAKAKPYIEQSIAGYKDKTIIGAAYHVKADILWHEGELDSAFYYYKKVLTCKQDTRTYCETYKKLTELSLALNQTDSSDVYFQQYMAFADSVNQIRRDKEISDIENNHVVELHDRELALQRSRLYWTWGILFVFLVFIASMIILLNDRRHKASALNYEQQLKDIERWYIQENAPDDEEDIEADVETDVEADVEADDNLAVHADLPAEEIPSVTSWFSLQQKRLTLYRNQYLASKWPGYFISHQADVEKKELMSPADSEQFLQYLSELFVNMMVDLYRESGHLNRSDMEFCCMTMLGFDANQIAYCCRKPVKYSYNRRTRLGERLTAEWYQFIFGKPSRHA